MPYEITFDELPIGYAVTSARRGQHVSVKVSGFSSTEDGDDLIVHLDGHPTTVLAMIPPAAQIPLSQVDHLLLVINRDKSATVYVNELRIGCRILPKCDMKAGSLVHIDDIADIERLTFEGVSIPKDAGLLFLFSVGWRKGLFFDFSPLDPRHTEDRNYDAEVLLGQYYAYLRFQQLFKITNDEWSLLMGQQWFPFITLKSGTIKAMLNHLRAGWPLDDLLEIVASEAAQSADRIRLKWQRTAIYADHLPLLEQALERFLQEDYISATAILYPRIEGIMRTHHQATNPTINASQASLVASAVGSGSTSRLLLLPERFEQYLRSVYFASFDPVNPSILSRNSVSHGVAPATLFDLKGATIGLLILEQLSFYFSS